MALVLKDRVRETSTTTGTGTFTLAGAVAGFQSFSAIGTGNSTYYTIVSTSDWEVGIGTWTSPNQLSRNTVLASTNAGALVTFGSGTKDVFLTFPAEGFAVPPAIGGTTPNTITGTTLTAKTQVYLSETVNINGYTGIIKMMDGGDGYDYINIYSDSADGLLPKGVHFPYGITSTSIDGVNNLTAFGTLTGTALTAATDSVNSGKLTIYGIYSSVVIQASDSLLTTLTLTLPTTAGSNNQVLKTDGTGNLSWLDFASPPAIGGTTPAAGTFTTLVANTSLGVGVASPSALLNLKAGTATAGTAPLKFTSGTNLTTAEAGAMEYNGTSVFTTGTTASGRGINFAPQMVRINTDRPKTNNSTTLEAVFDAANDTLALAANTLYYFKGVYVITKTASATAAGVSIGFAFSNAQQDIGYKSIGYTAATGTAQTTIYNTVATGITATATATGAVDYVVELEGWFKSNATTGGTLIPQFAQTVVGTGAAPSAKANTWFMIQPMSSTPTATLIAGNWS